MDRCVGGRRSALKKYPIHAYFGYFHTRTPESRRSNPCCPGISEQNRPLAGPRGLRASCRSPRSGPGTTPHGTLLSTNFQNVVRHGNPWNGQLGPDTTVLSPSIAWMVNPDRSSALFFSIGQLGTRGDAKHSHPVPRVNVELTSGDTKWDVQKPPTVGHGVSQCCYTSTTTGLRCSNIRLGQGWNGVR